MFSPITTTTTTTAAETTETSRFLTVMRWKEIWMKKMMFNLAVIIKAKKMKMDIFRNYRKRRLGNIT